MIYYIIENIELSLVSYECVRVMCAPCGLASAVETHRTWSREITAQRDICPSPMLVRDWCRHEGYSLSLAIWGNMWRSCPSVASVTVGYIRRGVEREIEFFIDGLGTRARGRRWSDSVVHSHSLPLHYAYITTCVHTYFGWCIYIYIYFNIVLWLIASVLSELYSVNGLVSPILSLLFSFLCGVLPREWKGVLC